MVPKYNSSDRSTRARSSSTSYHLPSAIHILSSSSNRLSCLLSSSNIVLSHRRCKAFDWLRNYRLSLAGPSLPFMVCANPTARVYAVQMLCRTDAPSLVRSQSALRSRVFLRRNTFKFVDDVSFFVVSTPSVHYRTVWRVRLLSPHFSKYYDNTAI